MAIEIAKTSTESEQKEKTVEWDVFHLDMIPDAMENMGWEIAPKIMRHWFSISPAYSFDEKIKRKLLDMDARLIPRDQINDDIVKMEWTKKFTQISEGIEKLKGKWNTPLGIERLREKLKLQGDYKKKCIKLGYSNDVKVLDATSQINILGIGSKLDSINDWYGAMGNSTLKVCVQGYSSLQNGVAIFVVELLGFYLKDTYDFVDDGTLSEPLGIWSKKRILDKKETVMYMSTYASKILPVDFGYLFRYFSGFVPIFNSDFRDWQDKHKSGGDFIVLSDVMWINPLDKDRVIYL